MTMRKNPWLENSVKNLIPLSISSEFRQALGEWKFTGSIVDHEAPVEQCELCEHEELRYHYEIENFQNENKLWVGSSCILRFQEINVYDENGNLLTEDEERKRLLDKALKEKLTDLMLQPLRELWRKDRKYRNFIERSVVHFKAYGGFQPKNLATLISRMNGFQITYKPNMFTVYLRSRESKEQLKELDRSSLSMIVDALSPVQKVRFAGLIRDKL